ncbi:CHRD domain-containing protein [Mariniblastus sp.]|jgi:hypothetical protein|nr:CHRD domain-containing protein [Mariniblastus sp.]MDB2525376.1 CHRD domain-containing protein [Mariniblastus sp.]MDB4370787.1 CHRD domain-containing protein [Mariniblastus sp.]MDC0284465.1 CHRD domain-containing protein [Mariniblastus sp.]|eukprot:COSAG01_NODE_658_length_14450_cov_193.062504_5_plen_201_part_00
MKNISIALVVVLWIFYPGDFVTADIVKFIATGSAGDGLLAGNIAPPTSELGTGGIGATGITFDTVEGIFHVDLKWGSGNGYVDLSSDVLKLHLHGPTTDAGNDAFGQTAPLLVNMTTNGSFNASRTSGGINGNFFLDSAGSEALLAGRTYINVHLSDTDTGVIRGYLQAVPEPGSLAALAFVSGLTILRRRRRKLSKASR